jgi:hypothetical protein
LEPWLRHLFPPTLTDSSPQIVEGNKLIEYCKSRGIRAGRPFGKLELELR